MRYLSQFTILIEKHPGCAGFPRYFGPSHPYYTLFGTELRFLGGHLFLALIFGTSILITLILLKKQKKIIFPFLVIFILSFVSRAVLLLALTYFFPVRVYY